MQNFIFVIMPFSGTKTCTEAQWTEIFENVFRPAAEEAGYTCERVAPTTGSLTASIVEKLHNAPIVLADVTDCNPNVFYELGIRHALSKRTIVTTQDGSHIPSDLKGYWYLTYGIRPAEVSAFRRSLAALVRQIEADPERSDSPVADYFGRTRREVLAFVEKENIKKLNALCTELTGNLIALDRREVALLSTDCLQLLLQTLYVDPGPLRLKKAYELYFDFRQLCTVSPESWATDTSKQKAQEFLEEILSLRRALSVGQFAEPSEPSYMIWKTLDGVRMDHSPALSLATCHSASSHFSFRATDLYCAGVTQEPKHKKSRGSHTKEKAPNPRAAPDANRPWQRGRRR